MSGTLLLAAAVAIGYYGPADPAHPVGGSIWQGVSMAIEEANRAGGDYRLVPEWDENPWSGGAQGVVRLAYEEKVVAIIGSIRGDTTHLAEQVVAKAQLPLVDPASTDRTVNAAFVPWMFSVMPDDRSLMKALVDDLPEEPFVLISSTAHDPRMMTKQFLAWLSPRRPLRHVQFERPEGVAGKLAGLDANNVVVLAGPVASARIVRDLRTVHPELRIYGSHTFGRRTFQDEAGEAAAGVRFPVPAIPSEEFTRKFRARWNQRPDYAAAYAYDATLLLVAAIREAGPDREGIREALLRLSPYEGVTGLITWDDLRRNRSATVSMTERRP